MPGQPVHFEIPADDTAKGRAFWGELFGWQFEAFPGPFEYHMTRISDQAGAAITNMEPSKQGIRPYFDVDDINAGADGSVCHRPNSLPCGSRQVANQPMPGTGPGSLASPPSSVTRAAPALMSSTSK